MSVDGLGQGGGSGWAALRTVAARPLVGSSAHAACPTAALSPPRACALLPCVPARSEVRITEKRLSGQQAQQLTGLLGAGSRWL